MGYEVVNSRITFGAELRYAMHVRGLSLTDVARHSGVAMGADTRCTGVAVAAFEYKISNWSRRSGLN